MRDYTRIAPRFWTGETGRALRRNPDAQRLALYLLSCPAANMIGLFYVAAPTICHEVGLEPEILQALWLVLEMLDFAYYDQATEMVWVPNMAREQLDETLRVGDKRIAGVVRQIDSVRRHRFARMFWDRYAASFSLASSPEAQGLVELFSRASKPTKQGFEAKAPQKEDQDQEKAKEQEQAKANEEDCAEPGGPISTPPVPASPPVLTFPCSGLPRAWDLTVAQLSTWSGLYPAVDVVAEARKALGWIDANPTKRKTHAGMPRFLVRWLGKAQDRGGSSPLVRAGPPGRSDGNMGVLENFLAKGA